jgi:hypothetical protein
VSTVEMVGEVSSRVSCQLTPTLFLSRYRDSACLRAQISKKAMSAFSVGCLG